MQPPPPFAALRRCRGTLFDRRCLGPLPPSLRVQFRAVRHSSSRLLRASAASGVQPPPPFKDIFQRYLDWEVLPLMLEKEREPLLRDTLQRWSNHKKMVWRLSRWFSYLDHFFVENSKLLSLEKVGFTCFRNQIYQEFVRN
ncbi:hypothetical protein Scep_012145 [Stephania cephalantha]|uniref:Cullin N-terminal domain-containing protein n=1 Tax=Stephania cephalantha TaxID=152367 RepID=A0AAP0JGQ7_9MAGN